MVTFDGRDLSSLSKAKMETIRGRDIGMVFQDPIGSLNPVRTVGFHLDETLSLHTDLSPRRRRARSVELLDLVGIPEPERQLGAYPFQFSGGMAQRVMIAMALSCSPKLLIADEPTTALDVTIQAQIIGLLNRLKAELGMAILFVTHDLGVVAEIGEDIVVMQHGRVVETGLVEEVFRRPQSPYTKGLLAAMTDIEDAAPIYRRRPDS
jgi:ABC-type dipeptide/oligopeptide/nickel transport system ATPase component